MVYSPPVNILLRRTLSVTPLEIYLSIKDLKILAEYRLSQIHHLCAQNLFAPYTSNFLEKSIGANFPVQLSLQSQFAKIENKKGITKNQCEKHKKLEFSSIK